MYKLVYTTSILFTLIVSELPKLSNYKLDFHEDFNSASIDTNQWEVEVNCWGGGNLEQQCYVNQDSVLSLSDSKLTIKPIIVANGFQLSSTDGCNSKKVDGCKGRLPVKSGRIRSRRPFQLGRFEIRCQLPIGNYLWPTFWLLPDDLETYQGVGWPAGGEIDILEMKGTNPEDIEFTLHHGGPFPNNLYTVHPYHNPNLKVGFHTFTLDYLKDGFNYYVDGNLIHAVNFTSRDWSHPNLPQFYKTKGEPWLNPKFYMILNLAVGGNYFGQGWKFDPIEDPKTWSQHFSIDYIKVYQ